MWMRTFIFHLFCLFRLFLFTMPALSDVSEVWVQASVRTFLYVLSFFAALQITYMYEFPTLMWIHVLVVFALVCAFLGLCEVALLRDPKHQGVSEKEQRGCRVIVYALIALVNAFSASVFNTVYTNTAQGDYGSDSIRIVGATSVGLVMYSREMLVLFVCVLSANTVLGSALETCLLSSEGHLDYSLLGKPTGSRGVRRARHLD